MECTRLESENAPLKYATSATFKREKIINLTQKGAKLVSICYARRWHELDIYAATDSDASS